MAKAPKGFKAFTKSQLAEFSELIKRAGESKDSVEGLVEILSKLDEHKDLLGTFSNHAVLFDIVSANQKVLSELGSRDGNVTGLSELIGTMSLSMKTAGDGAAKQAKAIDAMLSAGNAVVQGIASDNAAGNESVRAALENSAAVTTAFLTALQKTEKSLKAMAAVLVTKSEPEPDKTIVFDIERDPSGFMKTVTATVASDTKLS